MLTPISVEALIGLYLVLSFFFSALFVRFAGHCALSTTVRRHFYIFPIVPLVCVILLLVKAGWFILTFPLVLLRLLFEKLSGKRTFRRIKYYTYFFGR